MGKAKNDVIDTSAGQAAYALAILHRAQLDLRLPGDTIDNLAADLETLGVSLTPAQPPATPAPATPSLPAAVDALVNLVSAVHEAVAGAQPKPAVRKAYGAGGKAAGKELKPLLAAADKIVTRAKADPAEALSLGILPADVNALVQAVADVNAAEASAQAQGTKAPSAKEKRAAETRMHEATARIAGAGALAFAQDAATRAKFEALKAKKQG